MSCPPGVDYAVFDRRELRNSRAAKSTALGGVDGGRRDGPTHAIGVDLCPLIRNPDDKSAMSAIMALSFGRPFLYFPYSAEAGAAVCPNPGQQLKQLSHFAQTGHDPNQQSQHVRAHRIQDTSENGRNHDRTAGPPCQCPRPAFTPMPFPMAGSRCPAGRSTGRASDWTSPVLGQAARPFCDRQPQSGNSRPPVPVAADRASRTDHRPSRQLAGTLSQYTSPFTNQRLATCASGSLLASCARIDYPAFPIVRCWCANAGRRQDAAIHACSRSSWILQTLGTMGNRDRDKADDHWRR